jgi:hypothetical protein
MKKLQRLYIALFCLTIFWGCSIKETVQKGSGEEALKERVTMYWGLKTKEAFDKSYDYEDPYYRAKINMVNYIKSFNTKMVKWLSASPAEIVIHDDTAMVDVNLRMRVRPPMMKPYEYDSKIREKWVKVDGIWYHVHDANEKRALN